MVTNCKMVFLAQFKMMMMLLLLLLLLLLMSPERGSIFRHRFFCGILFQMQACIVRGHLIVDSQKLFQLLCNHISKNVLDFPIINNCIGWLPLNWLWHLFHIPLFFMNVNTFQRNGWILSHMEHFEKKKSIAEFSR